MSGSGHIRVRVSPYSLPMVLRVQRLLAGAGMQEENPPFRFLSGAEFEQLDANGRVAYLIRASDEIDLRQREFREQVKSLTKILEG
jgi:hypothetical protein